MRHVGVALAGLLGLADSVSSKLVETQNGMSVQGGKCETTDVNYFFSIPYAKPPLAERRYAPPEPYHVPPYGKVINGTNSPPACIQFGTGFAESGPQSEDW